MKIIIPLQLSSTRVKNKNTRPFYGDQSLFDIKAQQLLACEDPGNIYVSSESETVRPMADRYGFQFILRDVSLTGNFPSRGQYMPDFVRGLTDPLPGEDDILWVHVTSPLFNDFAAAIRTWNGVRDEYDSLMAVKRCRAHLVDQQAHPVNFSYGYWHKVSQDLPKLYSILWSLFILKRSTVKRFSYHVGVNPYLFEATGPVVDIDEEEDFELAQVIYGALHGKSIGR